MKRHNIWKERALFLLNFIKNPIRNASIIPSSKIASSAMMKGINWEKVNTIVELGPGSGTFTREILARCKPNTKVILFELETSYVELLKNMSIKEDRLTVSEKMTKIVFREN